MCMATSADIKIAGSVERQVARNIEGDFQDRFGRGLGAAKRKSLPRLSAGSRPSRSNSTPRIVDRHFAGDFARTRSRRTTIRSGE